MPREGRTHRSGQVHREFRLAGLILKQDGVEEFHYALRTILNGGFYVPPSMSNLLLDPEQWLDPVQRLTERERAVVGLYAQGRTLPEIAGLLGISVKTAETHRSNLGRKLGHPNRSQLTAFAHSPLWWEDTMGRYSLYQQALLEGPSGRDEYMSECISTDVFDGTACLRRFSTKLFGCGIRNVRQRGGESVEQAARRAGMDPGRWQAIEAGERVAMRAEWPLLARGLGMSQADLAPLIVFCQMLAA